MRKMRTSAKVAGVAVACAMGSAVMVAPANASVQTDLQNQLNKNPSLIQSPLFQLKAVLANLQIPVTLRLGEYNKSVNGTAPSTSRVKFDIGPLLGLGVKETTVYGNQKLKISLGWPLGTIKMQIPAAAGGNGSARGAGLNGAPVPLFKDANVSSKTFAEGGCSDYAPGTPDNPSTAPAGLDGGAAVGATTSAAATQWFADGNADTTNRTTDLPLTIPNDINGTANIFTGKINAFTLTTTFPMANVMRIPQGADRCRQAWTGSTWTTVSMNLAGSLKIALGVTQDARLKIGEITLATPAGKETNAVLAACLSPYKFYTPSPTTNAVTSRPTAACAADGSAVPAADGGSPIFTGGGFGKVDVPAKASVTQLKGALLLG